MTAVEGDFGGSIDWVGLLARGAVAFVLIPMVVVTIWIWGGYSRPSVVLVLEGFQMFLLAPAWLILVGSLVTRQWVFATVAAFVAFSHLAFCLPAATTDDSPPWAADAPTFSLFVANVRYDNERKGDVAALVADVDADVVVLNEMTDSQRLALDRAGVLARYPTEVYTPGRPFGEMLLTRLPPDDARIEFLGGNRVPAVTVRVNSVETRVFAIHVRAPKSQESRHYWRRDLDGIGTSTEARGTTPQLYAGDFNSAPWHGPYRDLLARGLNDAHDALGQGLSRSWTPERAPFDLAGPLMRLDHALFTTGLFPAELVDIDVPGSDHRGFSATIAVRQP